MHSFGDSSEDSNRRPFCSPMKQLRNITFLNGYIVPFCRDLLSGSGQVQRKGYVRWKLDMGRRLSCLNCRPASPVPGDGWNDLAGIGAVVCSQNESVIQ
jgi:hypothetical protein